MPVNKSASIRYRIIDACLTDKRRPFPSKDFLAQKCGEILGTEISASSIEKDLNAMKRPIPEGFGAPIVFSKARKGYAYSEEGFSIRELNLTDPEWEGLQFAAQLLHQYREVPIFQDFQAAIDRINTRFQLGLGTDEGSVESFIQFERPISSSGQEWIAPLYSAIKGRQSVKYLYLNLYKGKLKEYSLVPCLLKEQRNKWYVIGWSEERKDFLTFALDRVIDLELLPGKVKIPVAFNPKKFFQHSIGITEKSGKPELVELEFLKPFHELVLMEPLHQSQKILKNNSVRTRLTIKVQLNEELYLKLMGYGPFVRVIKPLALKRTVKEWFEKGMMSQR